MGCGYEISKWEHDAVQDSLAGKNTEPDPKILEETMPEVEKAIEERIEEVAEEKIDERIEKGAEREAEKELTPEIVEKFFTNEYHSWRQEIRNEIPMYQYYQREGPEKEGRKVMASLISDPATGRSGIAVYKQTPNEAKRNITHEFVEKDYELMPENEKERLEKEIWPTTDREKETNFFDQWGKGYGEYSVRDHQQNYCFWMTALKSKTESKERLDELKKINEEKFNFCKKRLIANEREVIRERLIEGGAYSPHSFFS